MTPFAHRENIRLGMRCGKVFRDAMWESVQGCDVGKCLGMRCGKVFRDAMWESGTTCLNWSTSCELTQVPFPQIQRRENPMNLFV